MIVLPGGVSPSLATPRVIDYGVWVRGVSGGGFSRTDRPGNRHAVRVDLPPVRSDLAGAALASDLRAALTEGLEIRWPQGAFASAPVGSAVVDGSDVQGTTLSLRGAVPNTVIRKGAFFSVEHGGKVYLHECRSETLASSEGRATIQIRPELRVILSDGDALEFDQPRFQGVIDAQEWEWTMRLDRFMDMSFDLVEMA
ncbi:hypothetical protein ACFFUB_02375 [Algimonas porphyrae]|uniref:Uncharacterized protein n=1 Tax=Algimonas porphyrae TaxID=1128113 RepID=A0ABQ5UZX5_9PROT|nr:hypothetical protein [Algimonas porphyrae]GLQ20397.1 hypothetical protein GCM10007854_13520 [Algimonas porphyrae]